jgi:hypothetical protein
MKYLLNVRIKPKKHYIYVKCKIENKIGNTFYINENFKIIHAKANCREIAYYIDKFAPHPPFDGVSRPVTFDTDESNIEIEYEGFIPNVIADVNRIDEDIIELASYAGWYPKPENSDTSFLFDLQLELPTGYELASNGMITDCSRILSDELQSDIAIFASNKVTRVEINNNIIHMVFLCPEVMLPKISSQANDIAKANSIFTDKFGEIHHKFAKNEIVTVLRPSSGWGYKRGKTSFMSYEAGLNTSHYILDFHELAHGWWSIASYDANDWINEGGAEFSAFVAAKYIYGEEYACSLIQNYLEKIITTNNNHSIIETNSLSNDRHINHYIKTTIMFITAQKLFGDDRVFQLLKTLYRKFAGTKLATTDAFLGLCDLDMREYFHEMLYTNDWKSQRIIERYCL